MALPPLVLGADEELGDLRVGAPDLDEVRPVERLGHVQRGPAADAVVRVGVTRGEPGLERVERERDDGAERRVVVPAHATSLARGAMAARTLRARSRSSSVHATPPAFAALRATSSTSISGRAAETTVRSSSVVAPTGAGVIDCSAARATSAAFCGPRVHE